MGLLELIDRWEADACRADAAAIRAVSVRVKVRMWERSDVCRAHARALRQIIERSGED